MSPTLAPVLRAGAALGGVVLIAAACVLGWIAVVAARRSEGVFLPAGYVALGCGAGGVMLVRLAMRY